MEHTVEEIRCQNGVRGLLINVPSSKVVECRLVLRAGFHFAPAGKEELPHFLEHFIVAGANSKVSVLSAISSSIR